ncbi:MAG: tRNA (guanosine(46)-N7)-methyltransferase TrmB [Gammaproteobacteria bacterium]|nr:tRNA (guanosine(46)-N7)-methyltransferase TrmB [Gammaproteobacteria bacterium]|tara:strand:+ start:187 stop:813 length:627 start_codon:yes stop_codon:yes gene_type:complete
MQTKKRPKYYKSFRKRKVENEITDTSSYLTKVKQIIQKKNDINIEIGFGDGESVIYMANKKKFEKFIAIESYTKGISRIVNIINKEKINNIIPLYGDAIEYFENIFKEKSISKIFIFFPDPWPKQKHRKRRIINEYSVDLLFSKLKKDGILQFSTDNMHYAYSVKKLFSQYLKRQINFCNHRGFRPITKYERKSISSKNLIFDLIINA